MDASAVGLKFKSAVIFCANREIEVCFELEGCQVKPVLQALILAERVYQTKEDQAIIVGTFNGIQITKESPAREETDVDGNVITKVRGGRPGSPYAYISLTDVCDNTELDIQFVSLSRNCVIFGQSLTIKCNDRLRTVEIVCALPHLIVQEAGVYALEILCEGEVIGSHRIIAKIDE